MKRGVNAIIISDGMMNNGEIWTRAAGAYRIATHLRDMGLTVQVIDFWSFITMEGNDLIDLLIEKFVGSETMFVAFSSTFFTWLLQKRLGQSNDSTNSYYSSQIDNNVMAAPEELIRHLREMVKKINPKTDIMLAGARADATFPHIDVVVYGYGEVQITDYVNWKRGKNPFFMPKRALGKMILDYNTAATGLDFGKTQIRWEPEDFVTQSEVLPIEISRGCIFRCKFCSFPLNGKKKLDYLKEEEVLKEELLRNYQQYGVTRYMIADDTYNDTVDKMEWMVRIKESLPFKLEFATYGRLDLVAAHPEHLDLIIKSGCTHMTFGIETLNQKAGQAIGKGAAPEKLIETLHRCREAWGNKIHTSSGFILGLPHDTYKTMDRWLEKTLDPTFPLHACLYVPLGIYREKPHRFKFISEIDKDPGKWGYTFPGKDTDNAWVNETYGTTFHGVEVMASRIHAYSYTTGGSTYGGHVLISVENEGINRTEIITLGKSGLHQISLLDKTYQRYLQYMGKLLNRQVD